jgi:hypothetical protein
VGEWGGRCKGCGHGTLREVCLPCELGKQKQARARLAAIEEIRERHERPIDVDSANPRQLATLSLLRVRRKVADAGAR